MIVEVSASGTTWLKGSLSTLEGKVVEDGRLKVGGAIHRVSSLNSPPRNCAYRRWSPLISMRGSQRSLGFGR